MTLATHAITGAAIAQLFPTHPILAFSAGFASHFILDAIPHWDYKILSEYAHPDVAMAENAYMPGASRTIRPDRAFFFDVIRTGADTLIGGLSIWVFLSLGWIINPYIAFLGAFAAILPDFLQLVYNRFPYQPVTFLQGFHRVMHAQTKPFRDNPFLGIILQGAVVFVITVVAYYLMMH